MLDRVVVPARSDQQQLVEQIEGHAGTPDGGREHCVFCVDGSRQYRPVEARRGGPAFFFSLGWQRRHDIPERGHAENGLTHPRPGHSGRFRCACQFIESHRPARQRIEHRRIGVGLQDQVARRRFFGQPATAAWPRQRETRAPEQGFEVWLGGYGRAACEHILAKTPVACKVLDRLCHPLIPSLGDKRRHGWRECELVEIVDQLRRAGVFQVGPGQIVSHVGVIERRPVFVVVLVGEVVRILSDDAVEAGIRNRAGTEVIRPGMLQSTHEVDRLADPGGQGAGTTIRVVGQQPAQRHHLAQPRQAVVADIGNAAGLESAADEFDDVPPALRADPGINTVKRDAVGLRQVHFGQGGKTLLQEFDVRHAAFLRQAARVLDMRRIEIDANEPARGIGRRQQRGGVAIAAAELVVNEGTVEVRRLYPAEEGDETQQCRSEFGVEAVRIADVDHITLGPGVGLHDCLPYRCPQWADA